ncbi:Nramp family divalent metal transporter [Arthrobacter sp.]|uniref:Nramp family divalent metal transporter n=1 Tax=Arthrobacter sp. TaxID=1667 RepID=UPI003A90281D
MSTQPHRPELKTRDLDDPYALNASDVQEPPTTWRGRFKFLGPGMITSAAVVGSGELLTATTLGAQVGFILLWLVLASTFLKVWVQIELGRWSISTGKVAVTGYDEVPPRLGKRGWMAWLVLLMFVQFLTSQAGVISASAFAFSALMPIGGDPFSILSIGAWVAILVVIAIAIHVANKYTVVEGISTSLVLLIAVFAVLMVFLIQGTEFSWTAGDMLEGMRFQVAVGSMGVALSMFGLTGVGAGEITAYTYWCVEKGYAAWSGKNDGSDAWVKRARGWISVMKLDAWVSWVVYTVSTAAFYILGAAVLHPQGIVPKGDAVMGTIASIFSTQVGQWGAVVFLIGAGLALFKTIIANVPSLGRQVGNILAVFGAFDWDNQVQRDRWMRVIMVVLPIVWGLFGTVVSSPLALVVLAGILNAVFLMGVAAATIYLSHRQTDPLVKDGKFFTVLLVLSALAIFLVGVLGLANSF